jgi:hypothetical protein
MGDMGKEEAGEEPANRGKRTQDCGQQRRHIHLGDIDNSPEILRNSAMTIYVPVQCSLSIRSPHMVPSHLPAVDTTTYILIIITNHNGEPTTRQLG